MAEVSPLNQLYHRYKNRGFQFFTIYVREAHPGEKVSEHTTFSQKVSRAESCKQEEEISVPVLVDSLDGQLHRDYGLLPNMIYVINRQGIIVYKSDWTDAEELEGLFENMTRWEEAKSKGRHFRVSYAQRLRYVEDDPETRKRVYQRAGEKAVKDYKKATGRNPF
ncbi:MAG: hypothetical protein V3S39_11265 [Thermodesulfobacteriota bacterium]